MDDRQKRFRGHGRRSDGLRADKLRTRICSHFAKEGWCVHGIACGFLHIFFSGDSRDSPVIDPFVSSAPPSYSVDMVLCRPCDDAYMQKVRTLGMIMHNPYLATYRI